MKSCIHKRTHNLLVCHGMSQFLLIFFPHILPLLKYHWNWIRYWRAKVMSHILHLFFFCLRAVIAVCLLVLFLDFSSFYAIYTKMTWPYFLVYDRQTKMIYGKQRSLECQMMEKQIINSKSIEIEIIWDKGPNYTYLLMPKWDRWNETTVFVNLVFHLLKILFQCFVSWFFSFHLFFFFIHHFDFIWNTI